MAAILSIIIITLCILLIITLKLPRIISLLLIGNIFWSLNIILNRLILSDLQLHWTKSEELLMAFLLFAPSIILISIQNRETNNKLKIEKNYILNSLHIVKSRFYILLLFLLLYYIYDLINNGWPIQNLMSGSDALNKARLSYRLPIIFSFANYLILTLGVVIACKSVCDLNCRKLLIQIILFQVFVQAVYFSRGSLFIFMLCILISNLLLMENLIKKRVILFLSIGLSSLLIFSYFGNLREQNNEIEFNIIEYGKFKYEIPSFIAWAYGYYTISLDNLIMCIRNDENLNMGYPVSILNIAPALLGSILDLEYSSDSQNGIQSLPYVGRFNLPTSYGTIGLDFGWFGTYIFSFLYISLFHLIISFKYNKNIIFFTGLKVYLVLSLFLLPIGNYILSSRFILFILALGIIEILLIKKTKKEIK